MVLWLKPWESRSLPGLPRTKQFLFTCHDQTKRRFPSGRRRFCFWASCYFLRGAPNEGTMSQKTRDLLALSDLNVSEIMTIVERAQDMAAFWNQRRMVQSLAGYRFALVVNDTGWRNTTAFDLGIQAMGGICTHAPLRWDTREDLADLAAYLDNWFDGIVTRAPDLAVMRRLAHSARAPVINARTRQNHPCETLGDLAFHFHRHGRIEGIKVGVVAPKSNILGSWI